MRRPSLFTLVVVPVVLVALLGLVTNLASSTVVVRDEWQPWVWGVGVLMLVLLVWLESRRVRRPEPVTDVARLAGVLEELAAAVRTEWQRVEVERQVADPVPLPVRWHEAPEEWVDHWSNIRGVPLGATVSPVAMTDPRWEIAAVYRRVPSGRLVIFGGAGAGKTVLAMRLVLDLLRTRAAGDPVPVVVNAAQWDVTQLSLRNWLIVRLREDHPALAQAGPEGGTWAAGLFDAGLVVPVLDGFDEIDDEHRAAALAALNVTDFPLVLTTRPGEYTSATAGRRPLSRAAGVVIDDLTVPDLVDYLPRTAGRTRGPDGVVSRWAPVLARLTTTEDEQTRTLAAALSTPLTISLARRIYSDNPDADPTELLSAERFPTEEAVRTHLFSAFLSTVYDTPPRDVPAGRWRPASTRRWLGHLAVYAGGSGAGRLAWWELGRMASVRTRTILFGLICTGVSLLIFRAPVGHVLGALSGLIGSRVLASRDSLELLAPAVSPSRSLRATRIANLRLTVLAGLGTCLGYGWFLHVTIALPYSRSLTIGPALALFGLLCIAPWGRWLVLVRFWLPLTGRLPWRVMAFLDDAHRRGVLRQTGTVYEFRHAKIQETLVPPGGSAWHRWRALAENGGELSRAVLRRMFAEWPATTANLCLTFGLGLVATGLFVGFHNGFNDEVLIVVLAVPACVALLPAWAFVQAHTSGVVAALREYPAVNRGVRGFLVAIGLSLFAPGVAVLLDNGFTRLPPDWSLPAFAVVTGLPAWFAVRADHRLFGVVVPPVAVGALAIVGADPAFVFAVVTAGVVLSLPFVARFAVVTTLCATCAAFVTGTGVVMVFLGLSNFVGIDLDGVLVDVPVSLLYKDSVVQLHWLSQVAFLVALVAAAVCLTRSARRGDVVGVAVSGSVFAGPPTTAAFAVTQAGPFGFATLAVFLVVPVGCVLLAVRLARRGDAARPTALCGAALVVASVQAGPLAGLPPWLAGVLIGVAGVLALALPGIEGAALGCCVLIGLVVALPGPHGTTIPGGYSGHPAAAVTFVVVAVLAAGSLVRRHPRPAVVAAATWLLLRATGNLCAALFVPVDGTFDGHPAAAQWALLTPLCLVGLPAVVLALVPRTAWAGQAAGAATLACGVLVALAPVWLLNPIAASGLSIAIPVDPVNIQAALAGEDLPAAGGVLIALLAPLAVAAIRRPHRYLAIAVVAALVAACHQLTEGFDRQLGATGLAAMLAGLALTAAALTAHTLSRPTTPVTPSLSQRS